VDPVNLAIPRDGSGRIFVVERVGRVQIIQNGKVLGEPFLDIQKDTQFQFLEQGLMDLEFHPRFKQNGLFYIHYSDLMFNGDSFIVQYKVSAGDRNKADPESAKVIMHIDQPYANHHGGELAFGPDGYLYIGSGDGGWEGDVIHAGQDLSTVLGKMLRIDVNVKGDERYAIPPTNPFANAGKPQLMKLFGVSELAFSQIHPRARPEIWAYGLRNPLKFQFDRKTGDLYIADVGQNHWEEIDFQPAKSKGGENYGWKAMGASHVFPIEQKTGPVVGVLPIAEYDHEKNGNCVIGFGIYRGTAYPKLDGVYFAGDWGSGRVWGTKRDGGKWVMEQMLDTKLNFTGAGEDEAGTIYVTNAPSQYGTWNPFDSQRGSVWRLVQADKTPAGAKTAPLD
jgi:glucose/arabinose dehydrogenase